MEISIDALRKDIFELVLMSEGTWKFPWTLSVKHGPFQHKISELVSVLLGTWKFPWTHYVKNF